MPGHDHGLAVQRHVLGMLGHRDMRQQRLSRPATLQQMGGGRGLQHPCPPPGAGVAGADGHNDLIARRDDVEAFRAVLTDPHHVAATAGAGNALGLDGLLDTRQVVRKLAFFARLLVLVRPAGFNRLLDRRDLFLGFGNGGLNILERELQLVGIELLGLRSELRAAVLPDLAFQLLDELLERGDQAFLFGHDRFLMEACRAFDDGFHPRCFNFHSRGFECRLLRLEGLQHLRRKVRKAADVKRRRHACSYEAWRRETKYQSRNTRSESSCRSRRLNLPRHHAAPVEALEQGLGLGPGKRHHAILNRGPCKAGFLENLVNQNKTTSVPRQGFQPVAAFRSEDHRDAGIRIELQQVLHDQRQSLVAAAEVDRPRGNQDRQPLAGDNHDPLRSARTSAMTRSSGISPGTRIITPPPNSIVMLPPAGLLSSSSGATITGTKAGSPSSTTLAIISAGKASRPRRACRRQSESWCEASP